MPTKLAPQPPVQRTIQIHSYKPRRAKPEEAPVSLGPQKIKHPYYDFGKLLSYNAAYNFLVGGRGLGKTYGAKKRAIKRALEKGEQFIYIRRYKDELIPVRDTFFADIQHEFPEWDLKAVGNHLVASPASQRDAKKREWTTIGYLIALSVAQQYKSVSYIKVKTIIFDEFIIEKGAVHYLPAEADVFNNFYSTVDRWQDKTTVFFLANSVSINNPYFLEYEIRPDEGEEFQKYRNGFIICHFPESSEFANSVFKTRFGQFIQGSDYADYAVGNLFADNGNELVGLKDPRAKYVLTLETRLGTFSLWHNIWEDKYYATRKIPGNTNDSLYTLMPETMSEDKVFLFPNDKLLVRIRSAFSTGKIWFESPTTRNIFIDTFKRR